MIKLTDRQKKILKAVEYRAAESLSVISEEIQIREHIVRYELQSMIKNGVISKQSAYINPFSIGLNNYTLYGSFDGYTAEQRDKFIKTITKHPQVSCVFLLGGNYDYSFTILAKSAQEAEEILRSISDKSEAGYVKRTISQQSKIVYFGMKHLSDQVKTKTYLKSFYRENLVKIDQLDSRILDLLSTEGLMPFQQIDRKLKIASGKSRRRILQLMEKEVISGLYHAVNHSALKYNKYKLLISAKHESPKLVEQLFEYCQKHPNIYKYIESLSTWSFELGIEVVSPEEFLPLLSEIQDKFRDYVLETTLLQIFTLLKYTPYIHSEKMLLYQKAA
ncbi:MAG: AsnC family transcriptional regulator [Deltaproteobacteria bacterium]|nr:AsnC family transcriptional regulator [Deltaproteobacteria bacterium]